MRVPAPLLVRALVGLAAVSGATAAALEEWPVDAGTTGVLIEDHRAPLVFALLEFPAGTFSPWVRAHGADAAFEMQIHDARGLLRRRADRLAVRMGLVVQARASLLHIACRKEDAAAALELAREVLTHQDFDPAEFSRVRQARRLNWAASLREPQFVLRQALLRALFPPQDPRRLEYEQPPPLRGGRSRIAAARDVLVRLPGRVVGLAGDLTLDEARELARGLLPPAAAQAPPDLAPHLGPALADRPPAVTLRLPGLTQAYFVYGRESLGWGDPDYAASIVADHALGGHFNSRLMTALRQDEGDSYGAGVRGLGDVDPGPWGLASFTRTENAARVERKLRDVLERFRAEGITEAERALAAGHARGKRAFSRESPEAALALALHERRHGLPYGFFDALAERAASLSREDVNAFIRRFHDPARFTLIVLRAE